MTFPVIAVSGGTQSLVDGSYEYYHYLQDRFDDNVSSCTGSINFLLGGRVKINICALYLKICLSIEPALIVFTI